MKKLIYFILLYTSIGLLGCESPKKGSVYEYQLDFLRSKIDLKISKLLRKAEETGMSPAGVECYKISEKVNTKINELIEKIDNNQQISNEDISEIIDLTKYSRDTVNINSDLLTQSLKDFNSSKNKDSMILSLMLFNLNVTDSFSETFNNYFYTIDYMKPVVISESFKIRKGEDFHGLAILQSKMAGIRFIYEIDDPQTSEGFKELPSYASSNYDGIVKIKGDKKGIQKIKIRASHVHNGKEVFFDDEFEIEVVE